MTSEGVRGCEALKVTSEGVRGCARLLMVTSEDVSLLMHDDNMRYVQQ